MANDQMLPARYGSITSMVIGIGTLTYGYVRSHSLVFVAFGALATSALVSAVLDKRRAYRTVAREVSEADPPDKYHLPPRGAHEPSLLPIFGQGLDPAP